MKIGNVPVGKGNSVFIIAELSGNHNKDFNTAAELIEKSYKAGANAVKIQTYTPDTITLDSHQEQFTICDEGIWNGKRLYDLYEEAFMPWEWQPELAKIANRLGIPFFSTPFDLSAVDFLEQIKVPAYKIASFEIVDLPLIKRVAETGKPVILSTGMASLDEIEEAVQTIRMTGNNQIILLKCTSAYPAPLEGMNLATIPYLQEKFGLDIGLSDHTLGIVAPIIAVSLGACVIEKHITLSRDKGGVDSGFSLEPDEFLEMTNAIRQTEKAMGEICLEPTALERKNVIFRRSLYVVKDIRKGEKFTSENVKSIRPGYGLPPKLIYSILGKKAVNDIHRGTPLAWTLIQNVDG
jgi:pseudaminic acid synthase